MIKMTKVMGVELKMSEAGITEEEFFYLASIHEVLGEDITAAQLPLSDQEELEIFQKFYS